MTKAAKTLDRVLRGTSDANVRFADLCRLARGMGFLEHVRGDHHIFTRAGIEEIINLQPLPGGKSKPYQVKQVRQLILRYGLGGSL